MLIKPIRAANVAIIGAGIAGLSCADKLIATGHNVRVFDKGRGPGGRMSTRRIETPLGDTHFDHGAQYFTARDPGFQAIVKDWEQSGVAARWPQASADAWVGKPGMNMVVKDMASRHDVAFDHLIKGLLRNDTAWHLLTPTGSHGPFDNVILAIPAEQAAPLLALHDLDLAQKALHARSQPCWTAMFAFAAPIAVSEDIIRGLGDISWAARNSAKPGRTGPEAWVAHASAHWSATHLEDETNNVVAALTRAFQQEIATPLPQIVASSAHRWRFALSAGIGLGALWNPDIGLGACGDWLIGPRVECAWLSGKFAAELVSSSSRQEIYVHEPSAGLQIDAAAGERAVSS